MVQCDVTDPAVNAGQQSNRHKVVEAKSVTPWPRTAAGTGASAVHEPRPGGHPRWVIHLRSRGTAPNMSLRFRSNFLIDQCAKRERPGIPHQYLAFGHTGKHRSPSFVPHSPHTLLLQ